MHSRPIYILLAILAAIVSLSPVRVTGWAMADSQVIPANPLPTTQVVIPNFTADLNRDGTNETVNLEKGRASIISAERAVWQSPADWYVAQASIADLAHQGTPQVVLLVWRKFAPWPIDRYIPHPGRISGFHNGEGESCHLILIGWKSGKYREVWAGSALAEPVLAFAVPPSQPGKRQMLVTLDGRYTDPPGASADSLSLWEWNGFGFTLLDRRSGRFEQLQVGITRSGQTIILTGE